MPSPMARAETVSRRLLGAEDLLGELSAHLLSVLHSPAARMSYASLLVEAVQLRGGGDMLTILHISDLHFGPAYVPTVGEAVVRAAHRLQPAIIIASGDFTQRAKREQFQAARQFLDRLPPATQIVVPGNHDVPLYRVLERVLRPYALYREYIGDTLDTVVRRPDAVIVALNSTAPLRAISNGRIQQQQLALCAEAFAEAPEGAARIVVTHHHWTPAPDYERSEVIPWARSALDVLTQLRVDLILSGHLHRAFIGNSLDTYAGADREHGILIVQCGTSTSRRGRAREREKNSFNWIRITERVIRITHYMFFTDLGGFAPVSRHIFPRAHRTYFERAPSQPSGIVGATDQLPSSAERGKLP
jgi:predicted MPP superfamily phosphohydrolase